MANKCLSKIISYSSVLAIILSTMLYSVFFAVSAAPAQIIDPNPSVTTCGPEDNLIAGGDCESFSSTADVTGFWRFSNFGSGDYGTLYIGADVHSGSKAIKLPGGSGPPNCPSGLVPIQQNTDYTFSVWYKIINNGGANFLYNYRFYNGTAYTDPKTETSNEYFNMDGQWHQIAMTFNSGTAQSFAFRYWFSCTDGSYGIFDDACLFETPASVPASIIK